MKKRGDIKWSTARFKKEVVKKVKEGRKKKKKKKKVL